MGYAERSPRNEPDYKKRQAAARLFNFRIIEAMKPGRWFHLNQIDRDRPEPRRAVGHAAKRKAARKRAQASRRRNRH